MGWLCIVPSYEVPSDHRKLIAFHIRVFAELDILVIAWCCMADEVSLVNSLDHVFGGKLVNRLASAGRSFANLGISQVLVTEQASCKNHPGMICAD